MVPGGMKAPKAGRLVRIVSYGSSSIDAAAEGLKVRSSALGMSADCRKPLRIWRFTSLI